MLKKFLLALTFGMLATACTPEKTNQVAAAPDKAISTLKNSPPSITMPRSTTPTKQDLCCIGTRSEKHVARDKYRHPEEILDFFGFSTNETTLEILPGSGYWTEIVTLLINNENGQGKYIAAHYNPSLDNIKEYQLNQLADFKRHFSDPTYGDIEITTFSDNDRYEMAEPGTVDLVMSFRNAHGWVKADKLQAVFSNVFKTLKPGGRFGLVQHRAPANTNPIEWASKGYVSESDIIKAANKNGFALHAKSEVNANPRDTKDYKNGVWDLLPSLKKEDPMYDQRVAIGESDRMTLLFIKVQ